MAVKPKVKTKSRGKSIDQKYYGDEIIIVGEPTEQQLVSSFNYYNYMFDVGKGKQWLLDYLKKTNRQPELIKEIKNAPDWRTVTTACWMARMMMNGTVFNQDYMNRFEERIKANALYGIKDPNASTSIVDNETSISIFKKIAPVLNTTYSASLKYQNSIVAGSINSSAFTYAGVSCFLNDDGNGKLQLSSTTNGISTVLAIVGSVDYSNGIINIVNLVISEFVGNNINIFANTVSHDFSSAQNVILQIDADNVVVSVLGIRA